MRVRRRREEAGQQRRVFEIAKEPAHGVERLGEVRAAAPVAAAERGAIAGEAAESGGHADGAAGVGADGGDRGAFLHAGARAGGRAAGERARVAGLQAVAEFRILAGDAIGERMQMGLAGDHRAGGAQSLDEPGVARRRCRSDRDRTLTPQLVGAPARSKQSLTEMGRPQSVSRPSPNGPPSPAGMASTRAASAARPCRVLPEIGVAAGVLIGVGKGLVGESRRLCRCRWRARCAELES